MHTLVYETQMTPRAKLKFEALHPRFNPCCGKVLIASVPGASHLKERHAGNFDLLISKQSVASYGTNQSYFRIIGICL